MIDYSILISPIKWLLDAQSRTFILYWLSSLLIIAIWASFSWQQRASFLSPLKEKSYWWNTSTRQDYLLIAFNSLLFAVAGFTWLVFSISIANSSFEFMNYFLEPRMLADLSPTLLFSAFTITLVLTDDLSRYGLHRLLHYRVFWRIHQLHHSATTLTPISYLRVHPIEKFLYQARSAIIYGTCSGIFFFFAGEHPQSWLIFGIAGASLLFNLFGANLRHSMIPISYGRLEKLFISPLQHQLHHSNRYSQKNFGSIFSIWDQIFKSWASSDKPEPLPKTEKPLLDQLLLKKLD